MNGNFEGGPRFYGSLPSSEGNGFRFLSAGVMKDLGGGRYERTVTDCNNTEHRLYIETVQHNVGTGEFEEILNQILVETIPCDCKGSNVVI